MAKSELGYLPTIIQIQAMPNDAHWQGCVIGLGDDGKTYISKHDENGSRWIVYIENNFTKK